MTRTDDGQYQSAALHAWQFAADAIPRARAGKQILVIAYRHRDGQRFEPVAYDSTLEVASIQFVIFVEIGYRQQPEAFRAQVLAQRIDQGRGQSQRLPLACQRHNRIEITDQ
jgi:hypothetical protein